MFKLNILNMNGFLQAVNACRGPVNLVGPNGEKEDINKRYAKQTQLLQDYRNRKNRLRLSLEVSDAKDYISILSYYAGDC